MRRLAVLALAACSPHVDAPEPATARDERCFILRALDGSVAVHEGGDACTRLHVPASTFKAPHAMIALETGARTGPDDSEKWDGTDYGGASWNMDQTLASAIHHSTVWYFKRTATRIGRDRMVDWLARLHYGNALVGNELTTFWLKGPLEISADEQADFWMRFVKRELPLRRDVMDTVDEMLLEPPGKVWRGEMIDAGATWDPAHTRIHAKTGSMDGNADGSVRWLVGHVQSDGREYVFVSLVVSRTRELGTEAITEAMRGLRAAGLVR